MECEITEGAMEGVSVNQEPVDTPNEAEIESDMKPSSGVGEPEFINIKIEKEPASPDDRIETETADDGSPPSNTCNNTWLGPIQDNNDILPGSCLDVQIKVEPDDCFQFDTQYTDDESGLLSPGPTTSQRRGTQNTREKRYSCRICLKSFANSGNVQRHMLLHTERKHHCTECPKQFITKEQLDKHMLKHTYKPPEKCFICEHCNKQFKTSSNLMQHKRIHMEVKPFVCTQCHRTFAFKANLTKHQGKSRCKRPIDEPIKCHVCNKVFEKEFLLKSHLRRHDTDRPFSCDQCTMKFKHKSTLIRHIQMHEGVRPYSCPFCDKTFTHSGLLKPHIRVHTGEKPYQCPICKKYFAHKHNMQRHAIRHNKIKHLVCDVCHKKFPKESRLIYHMKTHVNEKHFSCQICPKKFSHKQNVMRHYSRKHPNAKYECKETDASVALKVWDTIKSKYSEDPGEILG